MTLKRRVSLSDLRLVGSDTETSREAVEKPHLSSIENLRQARKDNIICISVMFLYRQEFKLAQQSGDYEYLQEVYANSFSSWEDIIGSFKVDKTYLQIQYYCFGNL